MLIACVAVQVLQRQDAFTEILFTPSLPSFFSSITTTAFIMVSAYLVDALRDPTGELQELFRNTSQIDSFPTTVAVHFSRVFERSDAFKEVRITS